MVTKCHYTLFIVASTLVSTLTGCKTTTNPSDTISPAVRIKVTQEAQDELQQTLSKSLHLNSVHLGEKALTQTDTLIMERRTLLGSDYARPTVFKLLKHNNQCILVNSKTKQRYYLNKTQCVDYKR